MILVVQITIICVMIGVLACLYLEELQDMRYKGPRAKVEEVWLGPEKRKHKRVTVDMDVGYSLPPNAGRKGATKTFTEDISMGGAKVFLEEKLDRGMALMLQLKVPNLNKPIVTNAEVAWVDNNPRTLPSGKRSYATGVMFTRLKPTDKKELSKFIDGLQK